MEEQKKFKNKEGGRILGGLILVAVGVVLLLKNLGYFFPGWLFSWPIILILVGIYSGVKHNFRNNTWAILIGIGGFFLADKINPALRLEPAFWPIIIIGLGVIFMFRPKENNKCRNDRFNNRDQRNDEIIPATYSTTENTDAENMRTDNSDYLKIDSVFSGVNRMVLSKNFKGGKIACVFGGAEVDLMQADFTGNNVIKMDIIFGGAKIIVPQNWTVVNEIGGIFHGVDDKRRNNSMASDPGKTLTLRGSAIFGGVEIRSY
ncbi:MAG: cell wall-active antibiotics response protein [Ferruginibacter sp.]|nr:cell wall-active antibiotics response protein [Ferruginibacter sp.]